MRRGLRALMAIIMGIIIPIAIELGGLGWIVASAIGGIIIGALVVRYIDTMIISIVSPLVWYGIPLLAIANTSSGSKLLWLVSSIAAISQSLLMVIALLTVVITTIFISIIVKALIDVLSRSKGG